MGYNGYCSVFYLLKPIDTSDKVMKDARSLAGDDVSIYKIHQVIDYINKGWEFDSQQNGIDYFIASGILDNSNDAFVIASIDTGAYDSRQQIVIITPREFYKKITNNATFLRGLLKSIERESGTCKIHTPDITVSWQTND